ncbi:hypothetical protein PSHT_10298 [Puccinia striiformis]|uniref:Uncharacterized protein n=2 Tax=Puccinia striiformis TaxID=27350 RepID=A0A2S4VAJ1_9BASI|nr:hypothetical protein PSHT_10298 [Puccinia striiformis]POW10771.1 hypothetical protein PSTT_05785 [Puccinia striiformis]
MICIVSVYAHLSTPAEHVPRMPTLETEAEQRLAINQRIDMIGERLVAQGYFGDVIWKRGKWPARPPPSLSPSRSPETHPARFQGHQKNQSEGLMATG